ncbi:hypothetical protein BJX62DRAFT_174680 [Aspergillus germanicus]
MSSNVGLSTPRGSGTSGYVQKNHAFLKPRNFGSGAPYPPPSASSKDFGSEASGGFKHRQPDKAILEHEAKREIEVKIEKRCEELRERLTKELEEGRGRGGNAGRNGAGRKGFKAYQVHEAAEAKIRESERFKRALGIRGDGNSATVERGGERGSAREEVEKRRERERQRESERD